MNEEIKQFINENEDLIQEQRWKEIYGKDFPNGFTETLLDCGVNPLKQGLNYIPNDFLKNSRIKEFTIPDNVTIIGYNAFESCPSLTSVIIGDNVTRISDAAFEKCTSLTSVTMGNSITSIGSSAFYNCSSLTDIVIPDSVTSIGWTAFYNCISLASINYNGTKKEWNMIDKGYGWNVGLKVAKVKCSDGEILL